MNCDLFMWEGCRESYTGEEHKTWCMCLAALNLPSFVHLPAPRRTVARMADGPLHDANVDVIGEEAIRIVTKQANYCVTQLTRQIVRVLDWTGGGVTRDVEGDKNPRCRKGRHYAIPALFSVQVCCACQCHLPPPPKPPLSLLAGNA